MFVGLVFIYYVWKSCSADTKADEMWSEFFLNTNLCISEEMLEIKVV